MPAAGAPAESALRALCATMRGTESAYMLLYRRRTPAAAAAAAAAAARAADACLDDVEQHAIQLVHVVLLRRLRSRALVGANARPSAEAPPPHAPGQPPSQTRRSACASTPPVVAP